MKLSCENCRKIDRYWRIDESVKDDLGFRMRRRALFHVKSCMNELEKAEWLKAGGMNLISRIGRQ